MSEWGRAVYGDPCRECGFEWSIEQSDAVALVGSVAARYTSLLGDGDGSARCPDLEWSSGAYVCHVADNLRIWSERLAGAAQGADQAVARYDADLLAAVRSYDAVPVQGSLWSLEKAAQAWTEAVARADERGVVLVHPDRGRQTVADVVRSNAHDAHHHAWDIERIERSSVEE